MKKIKTASYEPKRVNYFLHPKKKSKVTKALEEGNIDQGVFGEIDFVDEFFSYLMSSDFFSILQGNLSKPKS